MLNNIDSNIQIVFAYLTMKERREIFWFSLFCSVRLNVMKVFHPQTCNVSSLCVCRAHQAHHSSQSKVKSSIKSPKIIIPKLLSYQTKKTFFVLKNFETKKFSYGFCVKCCLLV